MVYNTTVFLALQSMHLYSVLQIIIYLAAETLSAIETRTEIGVSTVN
jgi:hypothetical protein